MLKEGANRIQITPFEGDAPFLDKIALVIPEAVIPFTGSWEAENAELVGAVTSPACTTASNGKTVNMGFNVNHAIRFNQVQVAQAGVYQMRVQYFSAVVRSLRVLVNGAPTTYSFEVSGPWCGSGGSPTEKIISVNLQAGLNQIHLTPITGEAPIIDKITVTHESGATVGALLMSGDSFLSIEPERRVFPNPVKSGRLLQVRFAEGQSAVESSAVRMMELKGRLIPISWENEQALRIPDALVPGFYIIQFKSGAAHKIWVE